MTWIVVWLLILVAMAIVVAGFIWQESEFRRWKREVERQDHEIFGLHGPCKVCGRTDMHNCEREDCPY